MREIVEDTENQANYPTHIIPIYIEDEDIPILLEEENVIEINEEEVVKEKGKKKEKEKKNENVINKKKKNDILPLAWCQIFTKENIIFSETDERNKIVPNHDVKARKSVQLFIILISGIDLIEAFAKSYQMITDKNCVRTDINEINSDNRIYSDPSSISKSRNENQNNTNEKKNSRKGEEDFQILLVSTALNVLQKKWPIELSKRLPYKPVGSRTGREREREREKEKVGGMGVRKQGLVDHNNDNDDNKNGPEVVLLIDNVKGEKHKIKSCDIRECDIILYSMMLYNILR